MNPSGNHSSGNNRVSKNRKYAFKRASVACGHCRKAKTRCNYLNNGKTCFRCANLGLQCSLEGPKSDGGPGEDVHGLEQVNPKGKPSSPPSTIPSISPAAISNSLPTFPDDKRLPEMYRKIDEIHRGIMALLNRPPSTQRSLPSPECPPGEYSTRPLPGAYGSFVRTPNVPSVPVPIPHIPPLVPLSASPSDSISSLSPSASFNNSSAYQYVNYPAVYPPTTNPTYPAGSTLTSMPPNAKLDTLFFNVTPFRDIRAVSSFFALPFSKEIAYDLKLDLDADKEQYKHDLISMGLIDYDTALELIRLFAQYYGRWTSFPLERSPKDLLDSIRLDSSLLLAVCCLMGLIHYKGDKVKTPSKDLNLDILREISSMLSLTVNYVPQTKQLLQSLVILSSFSMSLSYKNVYFDGWYLSGYALLHFISREMDLNLLSDRFKSHPDRINNFRLWNHLALTHITFCVLSGRPCLIDTLRMDQCREILQIPAATSFDGKVVAELSIILSLYNALQFEEPIEMSLREIDSAYEDWKYLRDQKPLGVFVEMDYRFSRLMIYRRSFLKDFGKDKGFIYHSPLMLDGEFPRNGIKEEGVDSLKKIVRPMIEECIRVIELAYNGDRMELIRCTDSIKFEIFFATVVMINMKRCGFGSLQSEINEAIVKSKEICEWLSSHGVYYNKFVESYYALISKFSDNIHEQEV